MIAHSDSYMTRAPFKFDAPTFQMRSSLDLDGGVEHDILATCTFCGSIGIDDAIRYLQISGTKYSGSDWKYGWPHKFYFQIPCDPYECADSRRADGTVEKHTRTHRHHKFYSEHMRDATPEQIEKWNATAAPLLGVSFNIDPEKGLGWRARSGHQADGIIP